jgi:spore germination protein
VRRARRRGVRLRLTRTTLRRIVAAALVAAAAAAAFVAAQRGDDRRPGPPPRVFAFVSDLRGAELERLREVAHRIDVVAPNWYALDSATGALRSPHSTSALLAAAQGGGARVWPVVNARTGGSRAWEAPAARERIAGSLLAAASAPAASGVTLDMEELRPAQRDAFTTLVRESAARLHAAGRKLAVYVPRPGPGEGAAYDWAALAAHADLVLCSGYNEHWAGGPPGPVSTTPGFSAVVDRALEQAGPARAVPLLGAFGYRWAPGAPGELLSTVDARRLRASRPGTATALDGSERFRDGAATVVYETELGLRSRAATAREAGARWIGLFSLGREPAGFWTGFVTDRTARRHSAVPRTGEPAARAAAPGG